MSSTSRVLASTHETYIGLRWVWREMVTPQSRRYQKIALFLLVLTNICMMIVPYLFKEVIDAHTGHEQSVRNSWLIATGAVSVVAVGIGILYDHFRERAWNNNHLSTNVAVVQKLLARTVDELITESSDIGIEQAESIKDRVQSILYLFMFDISVVLVTITCATALVLWFDLIAGILVLSLTIFNLGWFLIFNTKLDEQMSTIDKDFRRAYRRMVDKLTFAQSIKAAGTEDKVVKQTKRELEDPLQADLKIWGYSFLKMELVRRVVTAIAPVLIIWYGIVYAEWSAGTISAMFFWIFMISREYGFIGHLMRHLSSQVARLKAAREALSKPPAFCIKTGEPYHPSLTTEHLACK